MNCTRKLRYPFDMSGVDSHTSESGASLMAGWSFDSLGEQQAIAMMTWSLSWLPYTLKGMAVDIVKGTFFLFFFFAIFSFFLLLLGGIPNFCFPFKKYHFLLCLFAIPKVKK